MLVHRSVGADYPTCNIGIPSGGAAVSAPGSRFHASASCNHGGNRTVKLVSFEVPTAIGPVIRIGAVDDRGVYVDLQRCLRHFLGRLDATPAARRSGSPDRCSRPNGGVHRGRRVSRSMPRNQAIAWASGADLGDLARRSWYAPRDVTLLPPVPRPPPAARLHGLRNAPEEHLPPAGARDSRRVVQHADLLQGKRRTAWAPTARTCRSVVRRMRLDYEFELAMVIGKGGKDIAPRSRRWIMSLAS